MVAKVNSKLQCICKRHDMKIGGNIFKRFSKKMDEKISNAQKFKALKAYMGWMKRKKCMAMVIIDKPRIIYEWLKITENEIAKN